METLSWSTSSVFRTDDWYKNLNDSFIFWAKPCKVCKLLKACFVIPFKSPVLHFVLKEIYNYLSPQQ